MKWVPTAPLVIVGCSAGRPARVAGGDLKLKEVSSLSALKTTKEG